MSEAILQIKKSSALDAWKKGDRIVRTFLESLFGKEVFQPGSVMDRVNTFEDALKELGIEMPDMAVYQSHYTPLEKAAMHAYRLMIINAALNEGWLPNWMDSNQQKWYPWFNNAINPSGGFSFYGCVFDDTYTHVSSRLVFKSRELAEYAGKQFIEEYNQFLSHN